TPPNVRDKAELLHTLTQQKNDLQSFDVEQARRSVAAYQTMHANAAFKDVLYGVLSTSMAENVVVQTEAKDEQKRASAFVYYFTWKSPAFGGMYKSMHTFDVPFTFDTVDAAPQLFGPAPDPHQYELATRINRAFASFAAKNN